MIAKGITNRRSIPSPGKGSGFMNMNKYDFL